jgi:uncharacterized protein (TIGR02246 family)
MPRHEEQIQALHERVLDGWNQGSGSAFAEPFTDGARFIGFDGTVFQGRQEIADAHQELFDRWLSGSRLVEERTQIRFAGPDVAIVQAVGGRIARGKSEPSPQRDSIQTLVAVRDGGTWSFVSFQNTRIRPIGADRVSALLWLLPDKVWGLFFRATRTVPRRTTTLSNQED